MIWNLSKYINLLVLAIVLATLAKLVVISKLGLRNMLKRITSLIFLNIYTPAQYALAHIIKCTTKSFNSDPFTVVSVVPCSFLSFFVFLLSFAFLFHLLFSFFLTLIIGIFYCLNYTLLLLHLITSTPFITSFSFIYYFHYLYANYRHLLLS